MNRKKGFTLIEMVVVLAAVAILAAILTPTIVKNIKDAKIARTLNEAQVIGAALGSFYKDVGRWPTADGSSAALGDTLQLLRSSAGTVPAVDPAVTNEEFWLSTGGWAQVDTFENHLLENDPGDDTNNYPDDTTMPRPELRWRGPYLTQVKADPWGSQYSCNIYYTYNTTTNFVGIFSAGPDRMANTSAIQSMTTVTIGGDDIIFRLQ